MPTKVPARKAHNRRSTHELRIVAAAGLRDRMWAVLNWIAAEVLRSPTPDVQVERLAELARDMNESNSRGEDPK
jgi:hypothetical protein